MSQYSCNPHSNGSIQLVCALYQQGGLSNHTIRWIRSFGNIETEMIINETNPSNEDYLISILQPIEAEGPSDYWCQAGVYGEANSTYKPSAVFRVLPPDAYAGYPPCTGLFLSQQVSMFVGNGSILTPLGIIGTSTTMGSTDTPTTVGPSPSSEQVRTVCVCVCVGNTLFYFATYIFSTGFPTGLDSGCSRHLILCCPSPLGSSLIQSFCLSRIRSLCFGSL